MSQAPVVQWGMAPLLHAISLQLVNELRLAGFPDIDEGRITFGQAQLASRKAPPSITAMWAQSGASGVNYGQDGNTVPVQPVLNSLATELLRIDFHVWAAVNPPDPDGVADADACRYLCHQLWRVIHRGCEGAYRVVSLDPDQSPATALGARATLRVEFAAPVVDNLLTYLPGGTVGIVAVGTQGQTAASFVAGTVS